jgi:F-type H+-transporting ATPase subunit b
MLEFNLRDFIILVVNFLVLYFALNWLLFKPLAKVFKERETATKGALDEAKALTQKKDDAVAAMNADMAEARSNAKSSRDKLREEGLSLQKDQVSGTEAEAVAIIEKARAELQVEMLRARAAIKGDVEQLSEEIVRKLVKV